MKGEMLRPSSAAVNPDNPPEAAKGSNGTETITRVSSEGEWPRRSKGKYDVIFRESI